MATIAGYNGKVDWGSVIDVTSDYNVHSWSLDLTQDQLDDTDFASTGWRSNIGGLKGWTATCEQYIDGTNTLNVTNVGDTATLTLYSNDSHSYSGSARLSGMSPSVSVEGIETQTLNFQGTGTLSFS